MSVNFSWSILFFDCSTHVIYHSYINARPFICCCSIHVFLLQSNISFSQYHVWIQIVSVLSSFKTARLWELKKWTLDNWNESLHKKRSGNYNSKECTNIEVLIGKHIWDVLEELLKISSIPLHWKCGGVLDGQLFLSLALGGGGGGGRGAPEKKLNLFGRGGWN